MKFELKDSIRWLDVGHKMVLQVRQMVFTPKGSSGQGIWDEIWVDVPVVLPWQSTQQMRAEDTSPLCPECHCELHLTTAGEHVCRNEVCVLYR